MVADGQRLSDPRAKPSVTPALTDIFEDTWSKFPSKEQQTGSKGDMTSSGSRVTGLGTDLGPVMGDTPCSSLWSSCSLPPPPPPPPLDCSAATRGRSEYLIFISYPSLNNLGRQGACHLGDCHPEALESHLQRGGPSLLQYWVQGEERKRLLLLPASLQKKSQSSPGGCWMTRRVQPPLREKRR